MSATVVIEPTTFDIEFETLHAASILQRVLDDFCVHYWSDVTTTVAEERGLEPCDAARVVQQALGLLAVELHWSGLAEDRRVLKMPEPAAELDRIRS